MNTEIQEHHVMVLENTHPSGAEEWYCPTCGRRFLMHWPPEYSQVILEPGDELASHSGSKGHVSIHTETFPADDQNPWLDWMKKVEFDKLWDNDIAG